MDSLLQRQGLLLQIDQVRLTSRHVLGFGAVLFSRWLSFVSSVSVPVAPCTHTCSLNKNPYRDMQSKRLATSEDRL